MASPSKQSIFSTRLVALLSAVVLALTILCAVLVFCRTQTKTSQQDTPAGFATLQHFVPGTRVIIPDKEGLWLTKYDGDTTTLANNAELQGQQTIALCFKSKGEPIPGKTSPIRVARTDDLKAALAAGKTLNTKPLIIENELAGELPTIAIHATDGPGLVITTSGHPATVITDTQRSAPQKPGMNSYAFDATGWILWGKTGSAANGYSRALHVTRGQSTECDRGSISVLFYASLGTQKDEVRKTSAVSIFQPKSKSVVSFSMPPGVYDTPLASTPKREDKELFEALITAGLLRTDSDKVIRMAPQDLLLAHKLNQKTSETEAWHDISDQPNTQKLLERLYSNADGNFVRSQIRIWNQQRQWAAVRIQAPQNSQAFQYWSDSRNYSVSVSGTTTHTEEGLPDVSARLFAELPKGWAPWRRIIWPDFASGNTAIVRLKTTTPITLLALGKVQSVTGGKITSQQDYCQTTACTAKDMLQKIELHPDGSGQGIEITLVADTLFNTLNPANTEGGLIQFRQGKLVWRDQPHVPPAPLPAEVTIQANDGQILYQQGKPSTIAKDLGLESIVGLGSEHTNALSGTLGRLSNIGRTSVSATLTIDPQIQKLAHQILECSAIQGKRWISAESKCSDASLGGQHDGRRAGLVVLDADSGAILAASTAPSAIPQDVALQDILAYDRFNPANSPLRTPWQHDGTTDFSFGSARKTLQALMLELQAIGSTALNKIIDGISSSAVDEYFKNKGYPFSIKSPAYPKGKECHARTAISNSACHIPAAFSRQDGKFGLKEALSHSINTWFSALTEVNDQTLGGHADGGQPDALPLSKSALSPLRTSLSIVQRLGFGSRMRLDGGLLPSSIALQDYDVLQTMPPTEDRIETRFEVWQQAIGLRQQVTALEAAHIYASVATGTITTPFLLRELNGQLAVARHEELGIRLDRIHAGLKDVVENGTAAKAFAASATLKTLRRGVFGKTGTAPIGNKCPQKKCPKEDLDKEGLDTLWFAGWMKPDTIPGEHRRLAFAVYITRVKESNGGDFAAPVIASLLESLALQKH